MISVALIGPDGAGKTTIARRLERELELPAQYLYMGVSSAASNRVLPTTEIWRRVKRARGQPLDAGGPPPPPPAAGAGGAGGRRRALRSMKSALRLANLLAEEWYRQLIVWRATRRGVVVLLDRHWFADFHAHDIAAGPDRSLDRRVHGFFLEHLYPQPDLVVFLDAPPEVLFARKGEGSLEALARRREDYLRAGRSIEHFVVVDATRPEREVASEVAGLIGELAGAGRRS